MPKPEQDPDYKSDVAREDVVRNGNPGRPQSELQVDDDHSPADPAGFRPEEQGAVRPGPVDPAASAQGHPEPADPS